MGAVLRFIRLSGSLEDTVVVVMSVAMVNWRTWHGVGVVPLVAVLAAGASEDTHSAVRINVWVKYTVPRISKPKEDSNWYEGKVVQDDAECERREEMDEERNPRNSDGHVLACAKEERDVGLEWGHRWHLRAKVSAAMCSEGRHTCRNLVRIAFSTARDREYSVFTSATVLASQIIRSISNSCATSRLYCHTCCCGCPSLANSSTHQGSGHTTLVPWV